MVWEPNRLEAERVEKLRQLEAQGISAYPARVQRTHTARQAILAYEEAASNDSSADPETLETITVTVAEPFALAAGMKLSVPDSLMAGCTRNSGVLLLVTLKLTVCPSSFVAPPEMFCATPVIVLAPLSSSTVMLNVVLVT